MSACNDKNFTAVGKFFIKGLLKPVVIRNLIYTHTYGNSHVSPKIPNSASQPPEHTQQKGAYR
jgi:hypothetical protein